MMPPPDPLAWPVRVAPLGPVALGSTLWRSEGQLYVTAIAKATFAFSFDDVVSCVAPLPIRRADECAKGVPSLAGASETAPKIPNIDVVLVGHAFAPPGTTKSAIRLVVMGATPLIDKHLLVYGKRRPGGKAKPFERMRIGYERALGGLTSPENPIGTGADDDSETLPNVVDPSDPKGKVAGFGPLPSRFKSRRDLLGKVDSNRILNGIADYPSDFQWSYFHSAPVDQRISGLLGDEWVMLEGLHQDHGLVRTRLPSARALITIYSHHPGVAPILAELEIDTLHIESNENRLSMLWRYSFPIVSELAAGQLIIAGGLELPGKPIIWPQAIGDLASLTSPEMDVSELPGARDDALQRTGEPVIPIPHHAPLTATPSVPQAVAGPPMPSPQQYATPAAPPSHAAMAGIPDARPSAPHAVPAPVPSAPVPSAPVPSAPVPSAPVPSAPYATPAPAPVSGGHVPPVSSPYAAPAAAPYSAPLSAPQSAPVSTPQSAPLSAPHAASNAALSKPNPAQVAPPNTRQAAEKPAPRRRPPPPRRTSKPAMEAMSRGPTKPLESTLEMAEDAHEDHLEESSEPKSEWETTAEMDDEEKEAAALLDSMERGP